VDRRESPPESQPSIPLFTNDLQVSITAYSNWSFGGNTAESANAGDGQTSWHYNYAPPAGNPDLISEVDYYRYQRPNPALAEADLEAMAISYNPASGSTAPVPILLSASPGASPYRGDNANVPLARLAIESVIAGELAGQAVVTLSRSGASTGIVSFTYPPRQIARRAPTKVWHRATGSAPSIVRL